MNDNYHFYQGTRIRIPDADGRVLAVGDRVNQEDAQDSDLPAMRILFGTVVEIVNERLVRVQWDCDPPPRGHGFREDHRGPRLGVIRYLVKVEPEEERRRIREHNQRVRDAAVARIHAIIDQADEELFLVGLDSNPDRHRLSLSRLPNSNRK